MERISRRIAWTSAFIHGLIHASVLLLPALMRELQREFGVSLLSVLAAANGMYLAFGLAAVPAGYLADRWGSRRMLMAASLGCAASLLVISTAQTFWLFSMGLVLLGVCAGIYHPSGLSLLSRTVSSSEQGRVIGIHGAGGTLGEALAPAWAAFFATKIGWRYGFVATGVLALVSAGLAFGLPKTLAPAPASRQLSPRQAWAALRQLWQSRPLRWLLVCLMAGGVIYRGVLTFLPLHLSLGTASPLAASALTSGVLIAGIAAQRFGGELADRLPRERLFLAEVALYIPVLMLLGLTSGVGLVVLALCFGFLWYLAQPLTSALGAAYTSTSEHGLLYGVQFVATFGVGSFATLLGGWLFERGGTTLSFVGFGLVAVVQLFAALALLRSTRASATHRTCASDASHTAG